MTHPNTTRLSSRLRLLGGLALLIGLCIMLGGLARPAHAQSTLSVTDCSSDAQLQAEVAQANRDDAGDVISFACGGDIKLSSTLSITGSMTLSGSGQSVTLDGGDSTQILSVNSGVSLALKALTIAHGLAAFNNGDGIYEGGGIFNSGGTVTISSSTFANNSAPGSGSCGGGGDGGGIFNSGGTVTISSSTFSGNSANVDPCLNNGGSGGGLATTMAR